MGFLLLMEIGTTWCVGKIVPALMANFRRILSSDPRWHQLETDLEAIGTSVSTTNLFNLYEAKVYELTTMFERASAKLAGHDSRLDQVLDKLEDVKREILKVTPVDIVPDTTIDDFEPQMECLREGLKELNGVKPGVYKVVEGNDAQQRDRTKIAESIQRAKSMREDSSFSVSLYNMCDSSTPPHTPEDLTTCQEVKKYLKYRKMAEEPELWRKKETHPYTPQGIRWEYVAEDTATLTEVSLYLDVTPDLSKYIVVLRYHTSKEIDNPIPVPIACTASTLMQHLTSLWPEYTVGDAYKIDGYKKVTLGNIDETLCPDRTNELLVYVDTHRAKKQRWAVWRQRWKVAKQVWVRIRGQR